MRLGWMEIALIVLLIVILFGHNKFPGMMKNLAEGLNIFKKEVKKPVKAQERKTVAKTAGASKKKVVAKKK